MKSEKIQITRLEAWKGLKNSTTFHTIIRFVRTQKHQTFDSMRSHTLRTTVRTGHKRFERFELVAECQQFLADERDLIWCHVATSCRQYFISSRIVIRPSLYIFFFFFLLSFFYYKNTDDFWHSFYYTIFVEFTCGYIIGKLWRKDGERGNTHDVVLHFFFSFLCGSPRLQVMTVMW